MSFQTHQNIAAYEPSEQEEVLSSFSEDSHASSDFSIANDSAQKAGKWTQEEDELLKKLVQTHGQKQWKHIATLIPGKSALQCLHRFKRFSLPGYVKGLWSKEEDDQLINWVKANGSTNWAQATSAIKGRTGKQIRERWFNHLSPNVKRNAWSDEEDEKLFELYQKFGTSWSKIAKHLPGRAENSIKNRYYSTMRKINADQRKAKTDSGIIHETMEEDDSANQSALYRILLKSLLEKTGETVVKEAPSKVNLPLIDTNPKETETKFSISSPVLNQYKESMVSSRFDKIASEGDELDEFRETFKVNSLQKNVFSYLNNNVKGLKASLGAIEPEYDVEKVCKNAEDMKKAQTIKSISKRIDEMQDATIFSNSDSSMFNNNPQKMKVMLELLSSLETLLKLTKAEIGSLETSLEREGKTGLEDMLMKKVKID